MTTTGHPISLEEQIDQWRNYLRRRQAIHSVDVAELEDHLREQVSGLIESRREGKHNFYSVRTDHFGDLLLSLFTAAGEEPKNKKYRFHDFSLTYSGA